MKNDIRGFTLIELLVSVFVIALISGIVLANLRSGGNNSQLKTAAQKVASDIRLAQNYSLSYKDFNGADSNGGWGVYFNTGASSRYVIFADQNKNKLYNSSTSEGYATINLPDNISIDSLSLGTRVDIVFLPPDPITFINSSNSTPVEIVLMGQGGQRIKVSVNPWGLVSVGSIY